MMVIKVQRVDVDVRQLPDINETLLATYKALESIGASLEKIVTALAPLGQMADGGTAEQTQELQGLADQLKTSEENLAAATDAVKS